MTSAELLTRFLLQRPAPAHRLALAGLKPAAVLIPLVERPEGLHLLLTRRSAALRHHPGRSAFPAGARTRKTGTSFTPRSGKPRRSLAFPPPRSGSSAASPLSIPSHATMCCRSSPCSTQATG